MTKDNQPDIKTVVKQRDDAQRYAIISMSVFWVIFYSTVGIFPWMVYIPALVYLLVFLLWGYIFTQTLMAELVHRVSGTKDSQKVKELKDQIRAYIDDRLVSVRWRLVVSFMFSLLFVGFLYLENPLFSCVIAGIMCLGELFKHLVLHMLKETHQGHEQ